MAPVRFIRRIVKRVEPERPHGSRLAICWTMTCIGLVIMVLALLLAIAEGLQIVLFLVGAVFTGGGLLLAFGASRIGLHGSPQGEMDLSADVPVAD